MQRMRPCTNTIMTYMFSRVVLITLISGRHWYVLFGKKVSSGPADILSDMYSDIPSGIVFGLPRGSVVHCDRTLADEVHRCTLRLTLADEFQQCTLRFGAGEED